MQEYCKSPAKANFGLCHGGFQIIIFWPMANLPTQPLVQHSNAETPLVVITTSAQLLPTRFNCQCSTIHY